MIYFCIFDIWYLDRKSGLITKRWDLICDCVRKVLKTSCASKPETPSSRRGGCKKVSVLIKSFGAKRRGYELMSHKKWGQNKRMWPNVWSASKRRAKIKDFVQNQLCLSPGFPSVGSVKLSQSYWEGSSLLALEKIFLTLMQAVVAHY